MDPLLGKLFAGRFLFEKRLGTGGMGTVYLARHEGLGKRLAVKVIRKDLSEHADIAKRFRREARAASRVEHPNVAQIFDFGHSEEGWAYLAMEFIDGLSLARILAQEGPLAVRRAVAMFRQISTAIAAAHDCGVIHRDLKPDNIVITKTHHGEEWVKVLDFGLAKILNIDDTTGISRAGETFGTPEYLSPEQCRDGTVDHRSDIYSFGILAYETLVGKVPFRGKLIDVLRAHVGKKPPSVSSAAGRKDIPKALDAIIEQCLAKNPDERPATAHQLHAALNKVIVPSTAQPPPVPGTKRSPETGLDQLPALYESHESITDFGDTVADYTRDNVTTVSQEITPLSETDPNSSPLFRVIEELVYAISDRGQSDSVLSCEFATSTIQRDELVRLESQLSNITKTIHDATRTFQHRETQLRRVLNQIEYDLSVALAISGDKARQAVDTTLRLSRTDQDEAGKIEVAALQLATRLNKLSKTRDETLESLEAEATQFKQTLQSHSLEFDQHAQTIVGLIQKRCLREPSLSGDADIQKLLAKLQRLDASVI